MGLPFGTGRLQLLSRSPTPFLPPLHCAPRTFNRHGRGRVREGGCIFLLLPALLLGCRGTLEFGIEREPTPNAAAAATIAALQTENARLAESLAAQVTPTPSPLALGRVAYVQGGDLWVKALPSGKAVRLTTDGRNREPQPRWSPSGEWLAFRTERQVILQPDATCDMPSARQTVCDSAPALQKQVWLIGEDGSHARVLNRGFSVEAFAWSPVRDRVAFASDNAGLQVENADGTGVMALIAPTSLDRQPAHVGRLAWSPDGTWIAYEWIVGTADQAPVHRGIWRIALDGKERVELVAASPPDKNDLQLAGWTAQGKDVLFWSDETGTAARDGGRTLWSISSDSRLADHKPVRQSSEPMLAYSDFIALAPALSAQGRNSLALAVGAGYATWANKRIQVATPLTPKGLAAISPAWSPDGTRLAYSAMPAYENLNLFLMTFQELMQRRLWITELTGQGRTRQLTDSNSYRDERPLWSIDGSHLLFARIDTKGRATLWIIPADGAGTATQVVEELTPSPDSFGYYGHVDWDSLYAWWRGSARSGL